MTAVLPPAETARLPLHDQLQRLRRPATPPAGLPQLGDVARPPRHGATVDSSSVRPRPYVPGGDPTAVQLHAAELVSAARRIAERAAPAVPDDGKPSAAARVTAAWGAAVSQRRELESRALDALRTAEHDPDPEKRRDAAATLPVWRVALLALEFVQAATDGAPEHVLRQLQHALRTA